MSLNLTSFAQIRSLMHDYLATDGESSVLPDETDNRRNLYYGQRDKNKVSKLDVGFMEKFADSPRKCSNWQKSVGIQR